MDEMPKARLRRESRFSFIWLVPLICLLIAVSFAVTKYQEMGPVIRIHFDNAETISEGKTPLTLRGVVVGRVTGVALGSTAEDVVVTARLTREAADLAREGTVFTVVKPEVSISGVQGLSNIFSGSTLSVTPGKGAPALDFKGYSSSAEFKRDLPGLNIRLITPKASSIQAGDGVFYRGVRVGGVVGAEFTAFAQSVAVEVRIDEPFAPLIRHNTQFWEASGLKANFSLFGGAKIAMDSVQTLLAGGIVLATPDPAGPPAKDGEQFSLLAQPDPKWETWAPQLPAPKSVPPNPA